MNERALSFLRCSLVSSKRIGKPCTSAQEKPMSKVVLDDATLRKLLAPQVAVAIVDRAGNVFGHFFPQGLEEGQDPLISQEELQRRETEEGGRGRRLADILTHRDPCGNLD